MKKQSELSKAERDEQLAQDMARVAQYRKEHFEVRVRPGRLERETIEVLVTHNGSQWIGIDADSLQELETILHAIQAFINEARSASVEQMKEIVRNL